VAAPSERVWEAILAADLGASPLASTLLALRGFGGRLRRSPRATFPERLERFGFTKLCEVTGRELVFGLAGRFWRPSGGLRPIADAPAFDEFAEEGCVKAAWNLSVRGTAVGSTEISTETRIVFFGEDARRKFRAYWALVGPFSGLTRRALLRDVARRAERSDGVPTPGRTSCR